MEMEKVTFRKGKNFGGLESLKNPDLEL